LDPALFSRTNEGDDGAAHFGNEKTATEWAREGGPDTHNVGFRVNVPNEWLERHVAAGTIGRYEGFTEEHLEYAIPKELFEEFNSFPRTRWSGK
jgi:hypothetical protein